MADVLGVLIKPLYTAEKKFSLTLSVPESLKNSILDIPVTPQTLNINDLRTTSAKFINLDIIRKLIEYSLKTTFVRQNFFSSLSRYCFSKVGRYYDTQSKERVKIFL